MNRPVFHMASFRKTFGRKSKKGCTSWTTGTLQLPRKLQQLKSPLSGCPVYSHKYCRFGSNITPSRTRYPNASLILMHRLTKSWASTTDSIRLYLYHTPFQDTAANKSPVPDRRALPGFPLQYPKPFFAPYTAIPISRP